VATHRRIGTSSVHPVGLCPLILRISPGGWNRADRARPDRPSAARPKPDDILDDPEESRAKIEATRRLLEAQGDHLTFVSILVLAAKSPWDLVKVATAFALAHSITLTLTALDLVRLPGWIVEPAIAGSIVLVASQNLHWPESSRGRSRLAAAFVFGLFHGMGFAGSLLDVTQGLPTGTVVPGDPQRRRRGGTPDRPVAVVRIPTAARRLRRDVAERARPSMVLQKIGSAVILVAGIYEEHRCGPRVSEEPRSHLRVGRDVFGSRQILGDLDQVGDRHACPLQHADDMPPGKLGLTRDVFRKIAGRRKAGSA
jgi:hypothetical protein